MAVLFCLGGEWGDMPHTKRYFTPCKPCLGGISFQSVRPVHGIFNEVVAAGLAAVYPNVMPTARSRASALIGFGGQDAVRCASLQNAAHITPARRVVVQRFLHGAQQQIICAALAAKAGNLPFIVGCDAGKVLRKESLRRVGRRQRQAGRSHICCCCGWSCCWG